MVLYAIFGSSKQLVVGPVAVAALMVAATVSQYAPRYSDAYLGITTIICLQSGIFLWVLRLSRMGGLVNLLSHPVITGFVNAAAILIIVSQLSAFTGIGVGNAVEPFTILSELVGKVSELETTTFAVAVFALVLLLIYPKLSVSFVRLIGFKIPDHHAISRLGPMVVAIIAVVVVSTSGISDELTLVGAIPGGLPQWSAPPFEYELWLNLLPSSIVISLVSYIESYSIGTTLAARKQTRINSHQELIALGAANIGAAFTGAYPVAGSFSRSSVNFYAGGRTPVSSLVCAVVIVFVLLFFTHFFASLPHAVLAAIVMVSVVGLMDLKSSREHWALHRHDAITEYVTLGFVLFYGVEVGLIAGVILSIAFFIRTSSRPNITQIGRLGDSVEFRSIKRFDVNTLPEVLALRVDENIYFANAAQIEDKFLKRSQRRRGTKHVLMCCSSINMIDATGLQMLHRLNTNLKQANMTFSMCDVKGSITPLLDGAQLTKAMTGQIYFSADRAFKTFAEMPVLQADLEEQQIAEQEDPSVQGGAKV